METQSIYADLSVLEPIDLDSDVVSLMHFNMHL